MLVSIYYGYIDKISGLSSLSNSAMIRLIDDILFLSTDEAVTRRVIDQVLNQGIYGKVNLSKFSSNLINTDLKQINWAGFTLRPEDGKVNVSLQKQTRDSVADQVTVRGRNSGLLSLFNSSLGRSVAQSCLPILFDSRINDRNTLDGNAFRAGVSAGQRVGIFIQKSRKRSDDSIPEFMKKLGNFIQKRFRNDTRLIKQFFDGFHHSIRLN